MNINFDEKNSIVIVRPEGRLTAEGFVQLSSVIDAYLKQHDKLKGLIIETVSFPGWKNIDAFIAHIKFIKNHHNKIQKIAIVTNSKFAIMGKNTIGLLVKPEIQHFPYGQVELAKQWIL